LKGAAIARLPRLHRASALQNLLHAWKRQHEGRVTHDRGESADHELQRLRREVADLKRDRDALVKSIAVFVRDRK